MATRKAKRKTRKKPKAKKISRLKKPADLSLEQWQVALRKQFGPEQNFNLKNIGEEPIFSEFLVTNPETERQYRVAIRGEQLGVNFCSCPDFAVNTLGTCKHIEFTLAKLRRKRGGKKTLAGGFYPTYSEIYLRYGARRTVVFSPGAECSDDLVTIARDYFDIHGKLRPKGYRRFETFMKKARTFDHDLRCYDDALDFIAQVRDQAYRQNRIEKAFPKGAKDAALKKLLKLRLYPYQRTGALFAAKAGRSLIADDMGLGKTIQAIAATEILAQTAGLERVLIVCPTSLKHQWKQEIEKVCGRSAQVIEGLLPKRRELYASDSFYKIVNYEVIHRDIESIHQWRPEMVILDEAQRIKNWKTRRAQTVKKLESQYAIVLTGTPLENRLEELHSIVEFVDRFHLGPLFRFLAEHQHVDENGRVVGYHNLDRIAKSLESILIRRTKTSVLKELPERLDKNYLVPMTPEQMEFHAENKEIVARIVMKWQRFGFLSESDQRGLMIALQNMRMSCNSTYLLDRKTNFGTKVDELAVLLEEIFEQPDAKAVIFSQWIATHELIVSQLESSGCGHVLFHGGVPSPKRKELIKRFKEDPDCRVFLSTDAGGVGLNLQNASTVINMDLPWNPAVLEQRIGRAHRLGQHRPVRVVNFVAQGTIEHGMLSLLSFKQSLFAGVLDKGQNEVFLGGTRLKRFMESVDKATGAIPQAAPQEPEESDHRDGTEDAQKSTDPEQQAWDDLISTGLSLLDKLGQALRTPTKQPPDSATAILSDIKTERDPATGQQHLKVPIPKKETLERLAHVIKEFSERI